MGRKSDHDGLRLDEAARAGWLYYVAGNTQDEIARKLGISRQAAQRLVSLAISERLIKVRLDHPIARCMALEYAETGIRVNVVSPGNVAAGSSLKVFDEDPAYREFVLRVSLGRRNSPESIADAFVFLCSPLANEINGQILSPDYGAGIGNRL